MKKTKPDIIGWSPGTPTDPGLFPARPASTTGLFKIFPAKNPGMPSVRPITVQEYFQHRRQKENKNCS
jgi:hypothetical protein